MTVVACRLDPDLLADVDALRPLYPDALTRDGHATRSAVLRAILSQGRALLTRDHVLAVRGLAQREGVDMAEAWRRVVEAGLRALVPPEGARS